jgi:Rab GDP dissociation inhibitor
MSHDEEPPSQEELDSMRKFDTIVLGTGLKESILSGLCSSVEKQRVFCIDRNDYYGGESASLNLDQLYKRFGGQPKDTLGQSRRYCVDLCPKFLMACGDLVRMLLLTNVTNYLEFKQVEGSFVLKGEKLHKVPSTPKEAVGSGMLSLFEKNRYRQFLSFVINYEADKPSTHIKGKPLSGMTARQLFQYYNLNDFTQLFTGHATALYSDDRYLDGPSEELVERVKLYAYSVSKYGKSPYIYPKWGLGGLPEGFSRRAAVHGGVYMLNTSCLEKFIEEIVYHDDGRVRGVRVSEECAKQNRIPEIVECDNLIADPSYFLGTDKIRLTGQVVKSIVIMNAPIPNTRVGDGNADSCQVIIPATGSRKSDIYVCMASYNHEIADQGKYVAVMSTNVESREPEKELDAAMALINPANILERFTWVNDHYVPTNNHQEDRVFICSSQDATTHFMTSTAEVLAMYHALFGHPLDLNAADAQEEG